MSVTALSALLGVCGMIGWGVYDFLGGLLSRRLGVLAPLLWSQIVGALMIIVLAAAGGSLMLPGVSPVLLSVLAAALYCGGYLFFFAGLAKGDLSIVAATMNVWPVVTMSVAFGFMGQRLSAGQTFGAVTILCGATLASVDWAQMRGSGFALSTGVKETLLGALFFGLYWNVTDVLAEDIGWLTTTVLTKLGVVAILGAMALAVPQAGRLPRGAKQTLLLVVAMGVVELGAVAAVNYGLSIGDAILISPIASALSVVTIALAMVFLRERVSAVQGLGMAMAVSGVVLTAL